VEVIPSPILALLVVGATVTVSLVGQRLVRRWRPAHEREPHNEIVGFVIAVVGVLYAVVLGFATIAVWERHSEAGGFAQREAAAVRDIHHYGRLVEPTPGSVDQLLRGYAAAVIEAEWPAMAHGRSDERTQRALTILQEASLLVDPKSAREEVIYRETLRRLSDLGEAREERLLASRDPVPKMMWATLIAGALITVGYCWLFGVDDARAHDLMVGGVAAMIGLSFYLILALDNPFAGGLRIEPEAMRITLERITAR